MEETHGCWSQPALVLKYTLVRVNISLHTSSLTDESHKKQYFRFQTESCINGEFRPLKQQQLVCLRVISQPTFSALPWMQRVSAFLKLPVLSRDPP